MLTSLKILLEPIVDYAGLFPPAKLSLPEAMTNYAQAQMSPYSWMLGRFVIPLSRLEEMIALVPTFSLKQWPLSVILSQNPELDLEKLKYFNNNQIAITALELYPLSPSKIQEMLPLLPNDVETFFEIPLNENLNLYLDILQHTGKFAKIRTGGITPDAFPSFTQLSQAILSFAKSAVPFKATAGLHHPLLAEHPLTYEPDSLSTMMHGFLNVTVLSAFIYWQKVTPEEALNVLKETTVEGFQFSMNGIFWRNHSLSLSEIEEARQRFFRSFGSCSFSEPIEGLKKLKLFPLTPNYELP